MYYLNILNPIACKAFLVFRFLCGLYVLDLTQKSFLRKSLQEACMAPNKGAAGSLVILSP